MGPEGCGLRVASLSPLHGGKGFGSVHSPDFEQCETVWTQATVKRVELISPASVIYRNLIAPTLRRW